MINGRSSTVINWKAWPMRAASDVACLRLTVSLHERNTGPINLDQVRSTQSQWHNGTDTSNNSTMERDLRC